MEGKIKHGSESSEKLVVGVDVRSIVSNLVVQNKVLTAVKLLSETKQNTSN